MNLLMLTYEQNKMEEEFLAAIKMISGEEVLSMVTPFFDESGEYLILENPIVVEEVQIANKTGAKVSPWMKFSREDVFLLPKDKIITIVECDQEVAIFYEMSLQKIDPERTPTAPSADRAMGKISTVDEARVILEGLYNRKDKL